MNKKWVITNIFALILAAMFFFLTFAALSENPETINDFGYSTGRVLWEARSTDLIIQFVAMFSGALAILALTKEGLSE